MLRTLLSQTLLSLSLVAVTVSGGDRPLLAQTPPLSLAQLSLAQADPYSRALIQIEAGNYAQALELLNQALAADADAVDAYIYRGFVRVMVGDTEHALTDLNEALRRSPTAEVYKARAALRQRLGDHAGAIQDYDRALEQAEDDAESYRGRAEAYRMIGLYPAADYNYTQALAHNPQDGLVYRRRGELRLGVGEPELALADFTQAIALRPTDPEAYFGRAMVRSQLGDLDGAQADFEAAGDRFLLRGLADRYRDTRREITRLRHQAAQ
jgi:tetratricopeptide (TPR) repeat protein